ncbi:MAG: hypothetical protein HFH69_14095 [Lachnospiraceae bacterium]|nr:hypothetical protein [Lachnospiraceae bacterium]
MSFRNGTGILVRYKGRILRKGELQRSDRRYMYRYTNMSGERQVEYSWRLVDAWGMEHYPDP